MAAGSAVQQKSNWSLILEQSYCSGSWMAAFRDVPRICESPQLCYHTTEILCTGSLCHVSYHPLHGRAFLLQKRSHLKVKWCCFSSIFHTCSRPVCYPPCLLNCFCGMCPGLWFIIWLSCFMETVSSAKYTFFCISHCFDATFGSDQQPLLLFPWAFPGLCLWASWSSLSSQAGSLAGIFSEAHWELCCCWCSFLWLCLLCMVCLHKHQYIVTSLKAALSVPIVLGLLYSPNILQASLYHGGMGVFTYYKCISLTT